VIFPVEAVRCMLLAIREIKMEIPVKISPPKMRRSSRIAIEIAIYLIGSDMEGKNFSEQTKTLVLSRHGSGVVSQYRLAPEQEMIIRRLDTNKQAEVRVVGLVGSQAGIHTYGLAFLDPNLNFWGIEFPPATELETKASRGLFECSSCKGRETVDLNDVELDVYTINASIARHCKRCGSSTIWTRASGDPNDQSVSLEPGKHPSHLRLQRQCRSPQRRRQRRVRKIGASTFLRRSTSPRVSVALVLRTTSSPAKRCREVAFVSRAANGTFSCPGSK